MSGLPLVNGLAARSLETRRAPIGARDHIKDFGFAGAYPAPPWVQRLSGETLYVDGGVNIMA